MADESGKIKSEEKKSQNYDRHKKIKSDIVISISLDF